MRWYKKTAEDEFWMAYVQAVNAQEVRNLHQEDMHFFPDLAGRYPGPYRIEEMPETFVPPEPVQQLIAGNFDEFMTALSFADAVDPNNWTTVETALNTPTLTARLQPDGTLYLSGPALKEGVPSEDVQALTRFLQQHVALPPLPSLKEIEELEASLQPQRVDMEQRATDQEQEHHDTS